MNTTPKISIKAIFKGLFFTSTIAVLGLSSCKPSCPINSCQTRMVHRHGEQEFRGMPWYKKQNPRIGEKLDQPSKQVQKEMTKKKSKKKSKD